MLGVLGDRQGFPLGAVRIFLSLEAEHLSLRNERLIKVAEGKNEPSDKWNRDKSRTENVGHRHSPGDSVVLCWCGNRLWTVSTQKVLGEVRNSLAASGRSRGLSLWPHCSNTYLSHGLAATKTLHCVFLKYTKC